MSNMHSRPARCMFWEAPAEIRNTIYECVYGEARRVRIYDRDEWELDERERRQNAGKNYVPTPRQESMVIALLVSKQYFDEAAPVLFHHLELQCSIADLHAMVIGCDTTWHQDLLTWTANFIIDCRGIEPHGAKALKSLPCLDTLKLSLDRYALDHDLLLPWRDDYSEANMIECKSFSALLDLRGIKSLEVTWSASTQDGSAEQKATLNRNTTRAEALLREAVTKPRPEVVNNAGSSATGASNTARPKSIGIVEALNRASLHARARAIPGSNLEAEASLPAGVTLRDEDIPGDPAHIVRMFLARPHEMCVWVNDVKKRVKANQTVADELQEFAATLSP